MLDYNEEQLELDLSFDSTYETDLRSESNCEMEMDLSFESTYEMKKRNIDNFYFNIDERFEKTLDIQDQLFLSDYLETNFDKLTKSTGIYIFQDLYNHIILRLASEFILDLTNSGGDIITTLEIAYNDYIESQNKDNNASQKTQSECRKFYLDLMNELVKDFMEKIKKQLKK